MRSAGRLTAAGSGGKALSSLLLGALLALLLTGQRLPGLRWQAGGAGAAPPSSDEGPPSSTLPCDKSKSVTHRQLELQQQRRCALARARGRPPGGYVASCLVARNQHADLAEWIEYHHWLGISHFYVIDDSSEPPLGDVLAPYVQQGLVTHRPLGDPAALALGLFNRTCETYNPKHRQMIAYALCLQDYGHLHQFMTFTDVDEFLVITDGTPDLPTLLRDFEDYGGLAVTWRFFGSNGHQQRQPHVLPAYTSCAPANYTHNNAIKTIGNMAWMTRMRTPHSAAYQPGRFSVTASLEAVPASGASAPDFSRLALHHYFVKSRAEWEEKMARGNVMSDPDKGEPYWQQMLAASTDTCLDGLHAWQRWRGVPAPQPP